MDSADARRDLMAGTGQPIRRGPNPPSILVAAPAIQVTANLTELTAHLNGFSAAIGDLAEAAGALVALLGDFVDQDGREIWLSAGEVELDQWAGQVIAARDALAKRLK